MNCNHVCEVCGVHEGGTWMDIFASRLEENSLCFQCDFWLEKAEWHFKGEMEDGGIPVMTPDFAHYVIHPGTHWTEGGHAFLGFGGATFTFKMDDGRTLVSNNVWHQGTVPERFRHLMINRGEIVR